MEARSATRNNTNMERQMQQPNLDPARLTQALTSSIIALIHSLFTYHHQMSSWFVWCLTQALLLVLANAAPESSHAQRWANPGLPPGRVRGSAKACYLCLDQYCLPLDTKHFSQFLCRKNDWVRLECRTSQNVYGIARLINW